MTHALYGAQSTTPTAAWICARCWHDEYDVKVDNVIAGSGSEGIMSNIIRAFLCDEDEVLTTEAAFIGFQVLAKSRGVKYRTVPYRQLALRSARRWPPQINQNTKIIYLANPNNPTGTIFTRHQFDEFYKHVPERVLIILDEAYFEYAKDNPRYPGFDALPLRQRDHAAHLFQDLRPGGRAHRLRVRARGIDPQSTEGEAAVRAIDSGAGGRNRRAGRQGISAPLAGTERARSAIFDRGIAGPGNDGGASRRRIS